MSEYGNIKKNKEINKEKKSVADWFIGGVPVHKF